MGSDVPASLTDPAAVAPAQEPRSVAAVQVQRDLEHLRQLQQTFDHEKQRAEHWLTLQLVMGYTAVVLLVAVLIASLTLIVMHESMPTAVVTAASGAFFVDVLGLLIGVWKIVLPKDAPKTGLRPTLPTPQDWDQMPSESDEPPSDP